MRQVFEENLGVRARPGEVRGRPGRSGLGNEVPEFVLNAFDTSHGDPQLVEVNAKKALGAVTAHWQVVETGATGSQPTAEWAGGLRYGGPGAYFHRMRATLATGATQGQHVKVFTGGGEQSQAFTYRLASDAGASVLIMAAEDYKRSEHERSARALCRPALPRRVRGGTAGGRHLLRRLRHRRDEDRAASAGRDVAIAGGHLVHGRRSVHPCTGPAQRHRDDAPVRPGGARRAGLHEQRRQAALTGQTALQGAWDQFLYNPLGTPPEHPNCRTNQTTGQNDADDPVGQEDNCIAVSNDFMQYWLGTYLTIGLDTTSSLLAVPPFGTTAFNLDPAGNQHNLYSFLTTSSSPDYEAFNDEEFGAVRAVTTGGGLAFDPPEGDYMATASNSAHYQRLTRTFSVPALGAGETADLSFKLSYDTEAGYDMVFAEARTAGGDDYRTLPDLNGNTTTSTGIGCPSRTRTG